MKSGLISSLQYLKKHGETRESAPDCLEIDSEGQVDRLELDAALDFVFGKKPTSKIPVEDALLIFLNTMRADLLRRSYDESGEQKMETLGRVDELGELISSIRKGVS